MDENNKAGPGRLARLRAQLSDSVIDVSALSGAILVTSGIDMIYRPAAYITAGTFLLAAAWLSARKAG